MARKVGAKGEGMIGEHKASGLFFAQITVGKKPNGARNRRTVYGKTQKEVQKKLQAIRQEIATQGKLRQQSRDSIGEMLDEWFKTTCFGLKVSTRDDYERTIRLYLKPYLNHIKVEKFDGAAAVKFLADLRTVHCKSPRQVRKAYMILRPCFRWLHKWGKVANNPFSLFDDKDTPTYKAGEQLHLSMEQQTAFIAECRKDEHYGPLFITALDTGCRQGELFALTWDDVDLKSSEPSITVTKNVVEVNGIHSIQPPKTTAGKRTVPLSHSTAEMLKEHRKRLLAKGLTACNLVFPDSRGGYLRRQNLHGDHWKPILGKLGITIKFHELRHTAASRWLADGVDIYQVSRNLGHSTIAVTLSTYAHLVKERTRVGADAFDRLVEGAKG